MPYRDAAIVRLPPRSPLVFRGIGMAALVANTLLKRLVGYRRPRPPSVDTIEASLRYDARVVDEWTECLEEYENGAGRGPFRYAGRRVIDVSGDGTSNHGRSVNDARDAAVAKGIVINGLAILSEVPLSFNPAHTHPPGGLLKYYEDNVIGGTGAFALAAEGHEAFPSLILRKLIKEIALGPADFD